MRKFFTFLLCLVLMTPFTMKADEIIMVLVQIRRQQFLSVRITDILGMRLSIRAAKSVRHVQSMPSLSAVTLGKE